MNVGRIEFGPLYADRDPRELEPLYSLHVNAMTAEGLHSKADIAAELAARDREIDRLRKIVKMGQAVVEDFMPNIGKCVLQDFARLNTFLCDAAEVPTPRED